MIKGWMKNDEGWRMNDEGWWFQAVEGFCRQTNERTDRRTDICDCRVAFATEKIQDCHTEVRWRRLQLKVLLATGCPWNKTKCF